MVLFQEHLLESHIYNLNTFRHILDQPPLEETDGPVAIIMTPTRELCMQIGKDIRKFSKSLGLRPVCVYGGTGNY